MLQMRMAAHANEVIREQGKHDILRFDWEDFNSKQKSILFGTTLFFVFHIEPGLTWSLGRQGNSDKGNMRDHLSKGWNKWCENYKNANPYENSKPIW